MMKDLGTLGGSISAGSAINDSGQVTGNSYTGGGNVHAFLYSGGMMQDLGTLAGGSYSYGSGINESGHVVGYSELGSGGNHAFLYSGGLMMDLNDLLNPGSGWILTEAHAINDAGQITGKGLYNGQIRAFLLTPDAISSVPEPGTLAMMLLGGLGLAGGATRRKRLL
jgi:probable HAF family extracellular repeat protein